MTFWNFKTDPVKNITFAPRTFSREECEKIIKLGDDHGWKTSTFQESQNQYVKGDKGNKVRDSETVFIHPAENTFWIFERLSAMVEQINAEHFGFNLYGFGEGLQLTKYEAPTGHYDFHVDRADGGVIRKLSIVVSLSTKTDYEGGEFVIKLSKDENYFVGHQGSALVIPSYILHKVNPITKGTRYSLVGWVTGEQFR